MGVEAGSGVARWRLEAQTALREFEVSSGFQLWEDQSLGLSSQLSVRGNRFCCLYPGQTV